MTDREALATLATWIRGRMKDSGMSYYGLQMVAGEIVRMLAEMPKDEPPKVFLVTARGHVFAVKATQKEADQVEDDLISETGCELEEAEIDIEEWVIGERLEAAEGVDFEL
jgi:hypothetical protein